MDIRSPLGDTCHVSPCREPIPAKNFSSHLSPHLVPSSVSAHLSVLRGYTEKGEKNIKTASSAFNKELVKQRKNMPLKSWTLLVK